MKNNSAIDKKAEKSEKERRFNLILIIVAIAVAVAALAAGTFFTVRAVLDNNFDYLQSDLSRYVRLNRDFMTRDYRIEMVPLTETDADEALLQALYAYRSSTPENSGGFVTDTPISCGDSAFIYYRGYILNEDGTKTYPDGTCNFESSVAQLDIGSGTFISGFEIGLVGKTPSDYPKFSVASSGVLGTSMEKVYVTGTVYNTAGGNNYAFDEDPLVLDEAALNAEFAPGFYDKLTSMSFNASESFTLQNGTEDVYFENFQLLYATAGEDSPITVATRFPAEYSNAPELENKLVYFDVYVTKTIVYKTPEITERFLTDTVGISAETLNGLSGETPADKWKSLLWNDLEKEWNETLETELQDAIMEQINNAGEVIRLPKKQVEAEYQSYLDSLTEAYESYSASYSGYANISEFAAAYYSITDGSNYTDYVKAQAEKVVKEKLFFFSVMREYGLTPTDAELAEQKESIIRNHLAYFAEYYSITPTLYPDEAQYNAQLQSLRAEMIDYYGDDYYTQNAYYYCVVPKLVKLISYSVVNIQ